MRPSTAATSRQLNEFAAQAIRARRLRNRHFPESLFSEPAWDILLELVQAESEGRAMTVPELCEAIGVPGAIALRWLNSLAKEGLAVRHMDPRNPMGEVVELEPKTRAALLRYIEDLSNVPES